MSVAAEPENPASPPRRVCVVGSGARFLSGISYYTSRLSSALAKRHRVCVVLMRQLLPTRLYPGRERVGAQLVRLDYGEAGPVYEGVNWWWGRSLFRAVALLRKARPEVVVFQWWTGTVLHTYLALAVAARLRGAKVVIEFHELLDTGELGIRIVSWYVRRVVPALLRMSHGFVVHSEFDRQTLIRAYGIDRRPIEVVPHGPYDQYVGPSDERQSPEGPRDGPCRLLYFGVIRPFKGVEDIIDAFDSMSEEEARGFHLTLVGETWEGWTVPAERVAASPHSDRITFVNRYVTDQEVPGFFADADAVVLPYHRSSASGPLHIAMAEGLPVVVTTVGGLTEATEGYQGAIRVPPQDPMALRAALHEVAGLRGRRFPDVRSWDETVDGYDRLFSRILA